jgi:sulfoxide reductase heme-binding subunit YedZ
VERVAGGAPAAPAPRGASRRRRSLAQRLRRDGLRWLTHLLCAGPFLLLLWDGAHNRLTVNPIQEITDRTGTTALVILILSLTCTPLNRFLGWRWTQPLRRPLGLWGFFYAALHLFTFAVIDYALDPGLIWEAIAEKRYVLAGFSAFVLLVPLALTSTGGWMRRLGRRWTVLHRLIYLAVPLVILHYVWLVKSDRHIPLLYGAAVALLLALRTPPLRRLGVALRARRRARDETPAPPAAAPGAAPGPADDERRAVLPSAR